MNILISFLELMLYIAVIILIAFAIPLAHHRLSRLAD